MTKKRAFPVEALKVKVVDGRVEQTVSPTYNFNRALQAPATLSDFFAEYGGQSLRPLQSFLDDAGVVLD